MLRAERSTTLLTLACFRAGACYWLVSSFLSMHVPLKILFALLFHHPSIHLFNSNQVVILKDSRFLTMSYWMRMADRLIKNLKSTVI